jgi:hypothetical protein
MLVFIAVRWRAAGFHQVAPDMRGYGQTNAPQEFERYTLLYLIGDMLGGYSFATRLPQHWLSPSSSVHRNHGRAPPRWQL